MWNEGRRTSSRTEIVAYMCCGLMEPLGAGEVTTPLECSGMAQWLGDISGRDLGKSDDLTA